MNDAEIRPLLWEFLKESFPDGAWIEEFGVEVSRADMVVLDNGLLYGYEIKGSHDTMTRIMSQVKSYDFVFSYNYVVMVDKWVKLAMEFLPAHWGILVADESGISEIRPAKKNPNQKVRYIVMEMWSAEANAYARKHKLVKRQTGIKKIASAAAKSLSVETAESALSDGVRNRGPEYRVAEFRDHDVYVQRRSNFKKSRRTSTKILHVGPR